MEVEGVRVAVCSERAEARGTEACERSVVDRRAAVGILEIVSWSWPASGALPEVDPASVYAPARVPVFVIVIEPDAVSPIFIDESEKIAPEPERLIASEPVANALDEIDVGVAVKFAKVPPTAPTETIATAAALSRSFWKVSFLSILRAVPFEVDTHTIGRPGMRSGGRSV